MTNITIVEALWLVDQGGRQEMSQILILATIAFFTLAATAAGCYGIFCLYRSLRAAGASFLASVFFVAYALGIARAGNDSNKPQEVPKADIFFDTFLADHGSVATNDYPIIRWRYDPMAANDYLHIEARPKGSTNETDWLGYYVGRVTDGSWHGYMPGCTGMVIHVWSEYVPPPSEYTNGVFHLDNLSIPLDYIPATDDFRKWNLLRTPIFDAVDRRLMSPPSLPPQIEIPMAPKIEIPKELINRFLNDEGKENHDEK